MKIDKFVLAIACSILLAYLFPAPGSHESPIPFDKITSLGISLIFLFYGLKLRTDELIKGISNWKLHLLVQASTFILFPLLVIALHPLLQTEKQELLWLSFMFLAALPSTVSSSVVMVSMAKGNVPGAIFNASISGIIGIAITPLWLGPFISEHSAGSIDTSDIYTSLLLEILAPLILGLLLRRWLGAFAQKQKRSLALFDKTIILLIVYKSFVHSFEENLFSLLSWSDVILIALLVIVLFFIVYGITGWLARRLSLNTDDRIVAQFCGTKKSLVHGTVFSTALFGQSPSAGLMLLPLMIFHAFQILIISIFATRLAAREDILTKE